MVGADGGGARGADAWGGETRGEAKASRAGRVRSGTLINLL